MFLRIGTQGFHILHAYGLSTGHVYGCAYRYIRNSFSPVFLYELIELLQIHITFKRMQTFRIMCFIDDDICKCTSGQFLMESCRRKIHITRYDISSFDKHF